MDELRVLSSRLQRELQKRIAELNGEISGYPTPIARCDAQLPGLIEDRRRVTEALRLALELRPSVEKIGGALEETTTV